MDLEHSLTPAPMDEAEVLKTLLPDFKDHRKVDFLVLRSVNFTTTEALAAMEVPHYEYEHWIAYDEVFKKWALGNVRYIQHHVAAELLRATFMRNVFLQLGIDDKLLKMRAFTPDEMSPYEREEAKEAGKRYTAANVAAMLKVLEMESEKDGRAKEGTKIVVEISGSSEYVEEVTVRRANARKLADQFRTKKHVVDVDSIVVDA